MKNGVASARAPITRLYKRRGTATSRNRIDRSSACNLRGSQFTTRHGSPSSKSSADCRARHLEPENLVRTPRESRRTASFFTRHGFSSPAGLKLQGTLLPEHLEIANADSRNIRPRPQKRVSFLAGNEAAMAILSTRVYNCLRPDVPKLNPGWPFPAVVSYLHDPGRPWTAMAYGPVHTAFLPPSSPSSLSRGSDVQKEHGYT